MDDHDAETTRGRPLDGSRQTARLVLPHTDGEFARVLRQLVDLVQFLATFDDPRRREGIAELVRRQHRGDDAPATPAGPLPSPLAKKRTYGALVRVGAEIERCDRQSPVGLVARDGYRLVPLAIVEVSAEDLDNVVRGLEQIVGAGYEAGELVVRQALVAFCRDQDEVAACARSAQRLAGVLRLPWDDDTELLAKRIGPLPAESAAAPLAEILLTASELAAYQRIATRIASTWHEGDPLEALVYRR